MSEYIHHISGRLRLKLEHIRKQPKRAQEVAAAICRIRGVTSVTTNITTGSLLIRYDTAAVEGDAILKSMKEVGLLPPARPPRLPHPLLPHQSPASPIADKVVDVVIGKLIERSAVVLLSALL